MSFLLIWILVSLLIAALGAWLVRSGMRMRKGEGPHCRGCDYNLTGIDRVRCPECGIDLSMESNIVAGAVVVNSRRVVLGIVIILIAGVVLSSLWQSAVIGSFWNKQVPTTILFNSLKAGDSHRTAKAWSELTRRLEADLLDKNDMRQLIDCLLDVQKRPTSGYVPFVSCEMVNCLADPKCRAAMTEEQCRRFVENIFQKMVVSIKPAANPDGSRYITVSYRIASPNDGYYPLLRLISLRNCGQEYKVNIVIAQSLGLGNMSNTIPHYFADWCDEDEYIEAVLQIEVYEEFRFGGVNLKPIMISEPIVQQCIIDR